MTQRTTDERWASGGAHEAIVTVGDPILRQRAREVVDLPAAQLLSDKMVSLLRELGGAGLAAPQVGQSERIIVVEVRRTELFPDRPESPLYVMLNPSIERTFGPEEEGWEGCYSVPGLMGLVPRPRSIEVTYKTPTGEDRRERMEGYIARVVQHEYDHLDGINFLARMKSMESLTTVTNYKRFHQGASGQTS